MSKNKKIKEIRFTLRSPESIWTELKKLADSDMRSLNEEILWLIKKESDMRKATKSK